MPEFSDPEIYRTILDNLKTGVYTVDRNRRIRFWNEGAEQITGYLRQDVVGRFLREHFLASGYSTTDVESEPDDSINLAFRDGNPPSWMYLSCTRMDTGSPSCFEPTLFETAAARS